MDQKLYFQYFVQYDVEDGTLTDTKIPIDEIGVSYHLYIMSAKGIGGWVQKKAIFADVLLDYTAKLCMDQKLYFQYFVQDNIKDGTLIDTNIPIDEVGVSYHFYITSAKGIGGWVWKEAIFADVQY